MLLLPVIFILLIKSTIFEVNGFSTYTSLRRTSQNNDTICEAPGTPNGMTCGETNLGLCQRYACMNNKCITVFLGSFGDTCDLECFNGGFCRRCGYRGDEGVENVREWCICDLSHVGYQCETSVPESSWSMPGMRGIGFISILSILGIVALVCCGWYLCLRGRKQNLVNEGGADQNDVSAAMEDGQADTNWVKWDPNMAIEPPGDKVAEEEKEEIVANPEEGFEVSTDKTSEESADEAKEQTAEIPEFSTETDPDRSANIAAKIDSSVDSGSLETSCLNENEEEKEEIVADPDGHFEVSATLPSQQTQGSGDNNDVEELARSDSMIDKGEDISGSGNDVENEEEKEEIVADPDEHFEVSAILPSLPTHETGEDVEELAKSDSMMDEGEATSDGGDDVAVGSVSISSSISSSDEGSVSSLPVDAD